MRCIVFVHYCSVMMNENELFKIDVQFLDYFGALLVSDLCINFQVLYGVQS